MSASNRTKAALQAFINLADLRRQELDCLSIEMEAVYSLAKDALAGGVIDNPVKCFVDQDGNVHTFNPHTGRCTYPGDVLVQDEQVLILDQRDTSGKEGFREVVDEFMLYSSLQELSDAIEKQAPITEDAHDQNNSSPAP